MFAPTNILVATDFGEAADAALSYGRTLAHTFGATLHVLHIRENLFLRPSAGDPRALEQAALKHVQERLTDNDRRTLDARAAIEISDTPADAIVAHARTAGIDLIILGTHGRGGMAHALMGSVAEHVVRTAPCPVLTAKHPERDFVLPDLEQSSAVCRDATHICTSRMEAVMITVKNILVPTDFGEAADAALTYGRALAERFGSTLHVLHVPQNIYVNAFGAENYAAMAPNLLEDLERSARKELDELLIDSDKSGPPTKPVVTTASSPAFTIVDYAKFNDIDLIVMGTHGRGALAHLVMGSVAERVVRLAPCPVLTLRHPEHEFVWADALVAVAHA